MTQNIEERAKINTFRSVSAMIAIGIINIITVPFIAALGRGNDRQGYLLVAVVYGCIFAACHIFCFAKTKEVFYLCRRKPGIVQYIFSFYYHSFHYRCCLFSGCISDDQ